MQCLISFGSNLGRRESALAAALAELAEMPEAANFRVSRLYETPAIGGPEGQSPFLNGVAAFDTEARARDILVRLQDVETRLGRQRIERWGARPIDLDVVLHGNLIGGSSQLTVPHPRYTARRFVLRPACDVAPDYRDPRCGWTLRRLCEHIEAGSPSMALAGGAVETRIELCRLLRERHQVLTFDAAPLPQPMSVVGHAPAAAASGRMPPVLPPMLGDLKAPWVSASVGHWMSGDGDQVSVAGGRTAEDAAGFAVPRLIGRIQWTRPEDRWPAPHTLWPTTGSWPEYRLEVADDLDWTAAEIVSALESMRCPLEPVTEDGDWWREP